MQENLKSTFIRWSSAGLGKCFVRAIPWWRKIKQSTNTSHEMFWCILSLSIFTSCAFFWRARQTTCKILSNITNSLISFSLSNCFFFCSFLTRQEQQSRYRSVERAADLLNRLFHSAKYPTLQYRWIFVLHSHVHNKWIDKPTNESKILPKDRVVTALLLP